jgi:hypothetical protein
MPENDINNKIRNMKPEYLTELSEQELLQKIKSLKT